MACEVMRLPVRKDMNGSRVMKRVSNVAPRHGAQDQGQLGPDGLVGQATGAAPPARHVQSGMGQRLYGLTSSAHQLRC